MIKNQQFTSLDSSSSNEWKRNLEVRNSCLFNIIHQSGATILGIHKSQIVKKSVILYENGQSLVSKINLLRANALAKNFVNP